MQGFCREILFQFFGELDPIREQGFAHLFVCGLKKDVKDETSVHIWDE